MSIFEDARNLFKQVTSGKLPTPVRDYANIVPQVMQATMNPIGFAAQKFAQQPQVQQLSQQAYSKLPVPIQKYLGTRVQALQPASIKRFFDPTQIKPTLKSAFSPGAPAYDLLDTIAKKQTQDFQLYQLPTDKIVNGRNIDLQSRKNRQIRDFTLSFPTAGITDITKPAQSLLAPLAKKFGQVTEEFPVMFHGSSKPGLTELHAGDGNFGKGVYLTNKVSDAKAYAAGWAGGVDPGEYNAVSPDQISNVFMKAKKVFKTQSMSLDESEIASIKKQGYEAIQTPYETVVFDPKHVEIVKPTGSNTSPKMGPETAQKELKGLINYSDEMSRMGFTREQINNTSHQGYKDMINQPIPKEKLTTFNKLFDKWVGQRHAATTQATQVGEKFVQIPKDKAWDVIESIESPSKEVAPEVKDWARNLRQSFDKLYKDADEVGVGVGYLRDYVTHLWKESPEQVQDAFQRANTGFRFSRERTVPTYAEGKILGLTPKFDNPSQIIDEYARRMYQTGANIEFLKELKKAGLIAEAEVPGFVPITAPGINSGHFAPPAIAQKINRMFTPEDAGNFGKAMGIGSKISSTLQDVSLSGGIPKSPANAFSFALLQKELLAGRVVSPLTSFFKSFSGSNSQKFFSENAETIKKMQLRNIPVDTNYSVENLLDKGFLKNTFGEGVGDAWSKTMNEPTFQRFVPMMKVRLFNDIEKQMLSKGKSADEAANVAAKVVKNFYGVVSSGVEARRTQISKDTISTLFFAPKFRESMIGFWMNNLKSLKHPLAPENQMNVRFMVGAALLAIGYDQANRATTGHSILQNPAGYQDKILIPLSDGTVLGIPYLSSIATMPRTAFNMASSAVQGDFPEMLNQGKSFLSSGTRPPLDILTNRNYFGQRIYDKDDPGIEKAKDIGAYALGAYNHPYVRAGIETAQGKQPAYQTASKTLELPIRFYNNNTLNAANHYKAKANPDVIVRKINSLKTAEEKSQAWQKLVKDGTITEGNASIIKQRFADEKMGLTTQERKYRSLGVKDGTRARVVIKAIYKAKTKEEKDALYAKYKAAKIVTPEVDKQIKLLLQQRKTQ